MEAGNNWYWAIDNIHIQIITPALGDLNEDEIINIIDPRSGVIQHRVRVRGVMIPKITRKKNCRSTEGGNHASLVRGAISFFDKKISQQQKHRS